ncbi:Lrp/AsnC family transcriptional regulator [Neptunomonas sp.]|uniref:Lrp/AsnC family transcriptional regulator n=1 Tax=Neptunomonas sp. TaxID=1971898 RepID=UPI0025F161AE|nr:Lrp/AsnC family transcriptional regulator [Neptunomonas sp.]
MDDFDRALINQYQGGFPLTSQPFLQLAEQFGCTEDKVITRIESLLADGTLTRFGPLYDVEVFGGLFVLAAIEVPENRFEEVTGIVNGFSEVAHNYARNHRLNMWFVIACEVAEQAARTITDLEGATGLKVYAFPKEEEFYINLRFEV